MTLRQNQKVSGFTLIELMVTIAVFTILTAIAIPSYRYITSASHIASESNSFVSSLWMARSQAIENGRSVTICPSSDGKTCTLGSTWQQGWIVFTDYNGNQTVDSGDTLRAVRPAFTADDTVTPNAIVSAITFNREGFAAGVPNDVTFAFHDASGSSALTRCVLLERMGTSLAESYGAGACR